MYRIPYQILSSDTDANRALRLSRLFTLLQEASIAHTTLLGMGRERTLDRGLLWIVTLQRAQILRLPVYDERIVLKSWPGKTMHLLFPRYYRIEDEQGHALVAASALWALMDERTRRVVFPEQQIARWAAIRYSSDHVFDYFAMDDDCAIFEVSESRAGYMPELSYGSHIFQDLVEAEILYSAVFETGTTRTFAPELLKKCPNRIAEFIPGAEKYAEIIGLYEVTEQNCELYFDMQTKHLKIYL